MSYLQVKIISVLALMFFLQTSVSGQEDVIISIKYEENSTNIYHVVFSEEYFRTFYRCMCSDAQHCGAAYSLENATNGQVFVVDYPEVQNTSAMPVFQCRNDPNYPSLECSQQYSPKHVRAQTFRLHNPECQSRYVTLVWLYKEESLTVNTDIPDFEFCEPAFDCASATKIPETSPASAKTSSSSSSSSSEFSTAANEQDEDDDNAGVMAGIAVAVFIVGIGVGIVVVVVVVRWRRRKNQGTKEPGNQSTISPPPASLSLSGTISAADPSTNANSVPSGTAEAPPSEPSSIASISVAQNDYSQIDVSNTDGHAYAALSPSPYYNSTNAISTESTYEQNTYTANSKPAYCNTPDATPNSSSAYSNTQRGPTNIMSEQPDTETEGAYEEADVAYSPGRGDGVNLNASADRMTEQNDSTIYCN